MVNLYSAVDLQVTQCFANGRVIDLAYLLAAFYLRVNDTNLVVKERRQIAARDVAVFVDGCGEDGSTILPVPGGVVSPPAKEGDSEGCSANDHRYADLRHSPPQRDLAQPNGTVRVQSLSEPPEYAEHHQTAQ